MKELICIVCPRGCHLKVDEANGCKVTGNSCPRGEQYGKAELLNPHIHRTHRRGAPSPVPRKNKRSDTQGEDPGGHGPFRRSHFKSARFHGADSHKRRMPDGDRPGDHQEHRPLAGA